MSGYVPFGSRLLDLLKDVRQCDEYGTLADLLDDVERLNGWANETEKRFCIAYAAVICQRMEVLASRPPHWAKTFVRPH